MNEARVSFFVRPARVQDADVVTEHRMALFRETGGIHSDAAATGALEEATRDAVAEGVRTGTCLGWLALAATGEAIGSCAMHVFPRLPSPQNPSAREGYVVHLFVRQAWRRTGIGSALLTAAIEEARRRGLRRIRLHATEEGRALYEGLGFTPRTNDMELHVPHNRYNPIP